MTRRISCRIAIAGVSAMLALGDRAAWSDASTAGPAVAERHRIAPRGASARRAGEEAEGTRGWWLGTAGIALALAACGGISVAARRYGPQAAAGPLRVIGRTSLSPRHTVYLLKAGGRVLIVGTGPQGAPSLLGELDDPDEPGPSPPRDQARGFDRLVGGGDDA
jgi:hypothetical protein